MKSLFYYFVMTKNKIKNPNSRIIIDIFYLLLDNVISDNNWIIENAKSVILVSNDTKMDLFIISVNIIELLKIK